MIASRRSFITGLVALVAAPAIVRAGSLMPVNSGLVPGLSLFDLPQYNGVSMRYIVDYVPLVPEARMDVLYGQTRAFVGGEQWSSEECRALMERQAVYNEAFAAGGAKIGDVIRIRLPNDFVVSDGPGLTGLEIVQGVAYRYVKARRTLEPIPQIPDSLALAAAAVALAAAAVAIAPVVLAKPVTRRFWGK